MHPEILTVPEPLTPAAELDDRFALRHALVPAHASLAWKGVVDLVLGFLLLVLLTPFILAAALLIKLTSRGPAFYTQTRVGKHGRLYTIYKLRTMVVDSEAKSGAVWATTGDPRITPLGKFLRDTHIDEFPQLVNVLLGHMSLIGPRPERPAIVEYLRTQIPEYTDRLQVLPGITGLAQVQLPPDVDLEGVRKKLVCDLHYIRHLHGRLDLAILICTGCMFFRIPLGWARRVLRIPEPL